MLPVRSRLKDRSVLTTTVRRGTRAGRRYLVVHFMPPEPSSVDSPQVAFAVNKAVGGSVVRHRVARRLRHVVAHHLDELPAGSSLVVRALPAAANASSDDFERDIQVLLPRVVGQCG